MKQIRVSKSCSGCGVCVLTCKYLQENDDGNAEPVPGMAILEEDIENVNEVIHSCPERAITIYETGLTNKTGKAGIEEFKEKAIELIKKIPKMKYPSLREYQFKKDEYSIDYSYPKGQNQYDYSSTLNI